MLHDKNTHFTHNVQGFNFEKEVHNLMIYLHGLILHVNIVFFQEHKVRVQKIISLFGKMLLIGLSKLHLTTRIYTMKKG
jgi:hypothetical protein